MQPRATINLSKAAKLIDDKSSLVADPSAAPETKGNGKKRRKSAFAEEDEGYQFVEEGFRIRFSNGETIDFYAATTAEKDSWMSVLSQAVGRNFVGAPSKGAAKWTEMVLSHESRMKARKSRNPTVTTPTMAPEINVCPPTSSLNSLDLSSASGGAGWTKSAPTSPVKPVRKEVPRSPVVGGPRVPPRGASVQDNNKTVPPESRWLAKKDLPLAPLESHRPGTPPLGKRTDGRTRKAVKSMIL